MLAGGTTLGLVSVAGLAAGPVATAGADSTGYTLHCKGTGLTLHIPGAVTTGTLPSSVTPGKSFTMTGYGLTIALPATLAPVAAGHSIKGTYTTSVTATGATPTPQSTTLTVPLTSIPKPATGAKLDRQRPERQLHGRQRSGDGLGLGRHDRHAGPDSDSDRAERLGPPVMHKPGHHHRHHDDRRPPDQRLGRAAQLGSLWPAATR